LWIGAIGLRSVSGDFEYEVLDYQPRFTNWLQKRMAMIAFQLVVQHRAAGVLTSTNFNLDALVGQPVSFVAQNLIFCPRASRKTTSVATAMQVIFRLASDQNIFVFS
jgi:hypothetical protein